MRLGEGGRSFRTLGKASHLVVAKLSAMLATLVVAARSSVRLHHAMRVVTQLALS